ncbi:organic cation transporter protein-like isoform X1 [Octopus sinensis]|uniref:Organic cation transporter protein-like isoform X1 n=1 Tax=Octopus sinensis TaxID=2607531 RepID=A0A7E6FBR1_9MOLL|nr:organic cation transporter protein-like isoform X1 [Octopus sinensis]
MESFKDNSDSKTNIESLQLKEKTTHTETIEALLKRCGGFGPYQKKIASLLVLYFLLSPLQTMSMAFIGAKVPFSCTPPNFNSSLVPKNFSIKTFKDLLSPEDDRCSVYEINMDGDYYQIPTKNSTRMECSQNREFHTENISSVVSEFNLVCERKWLKSCSKSVFFAGRLIGAFVFGILADRYGRHHCFFFGLTLMIASGIINIFINSFIVFIFLYFFQGFGQVGSYFCSYTIMIELVSTKYRSPLNFSLHIMYATGVMVLVGFAYALPSWRHLECAICVPFVVYIFTWKLLPESPRWLIGRERYAEAELLLREIAKTNGKDPDIINEQFESLITESKEKREKQKTEKTYTFIDLIKKPYLAFISFNVWFNWFANSMLYYGVTLNAVDMAGDPYINFLIMAVVEIPACLVCMWFFHCFGHRKPISFFMVFGGINCIISNFIQKGSVWIPLFFAVLGKFGATAAYGGIYLVSAEVFPTVARNTGIGMSSVFSRVGGICAPFLLELSTYVYWLPLTTFGIISILFGFLLLLLREMKDSSLPQSMDDMGKLRKHSEKL